MLYQYLVNIPMNVLVLTPDAVGSTLLQRLLTIYMQFHDYDRPVINLHELTNGIYPYYNDDFNREVLGKHPDKWGYYQSLPEITRLLEAADHYKVCRLALYHLNARRDQIAEQVPFYQYLNQNFFIIQTCRRNLFEHGLSWAINKITKKLNVYTHNEKIGTFLDMFRDPITIDVSSMIHSLDNYKNYLTWAEDCFTVGSYFYYEDHLADIERYILQLPIFANQPRLTTWQDTYGIDFQEYNLCHYFNSDIGSLALTQKELPRLSYHDQSDPKFGDPDGAVVPYLSSDKQQFLQTRQAAYRDVESSLRKMVDLGIMIGGVPIKKQTMVEKRAMIKNFEQCRQAYNEWAARHPNIASVVDDESLQQQYQHDQEVWQKPLLKLASAKSDVPAIGSS